MRAGLTARLFPIRPHGQCPFLFPEGRELTLPHMCCCLTTGLFRSPTSPTSPTSTAPLKQLPHPLLREDLQVCSLKKCMARCLSSLPFRVLTHLVPLKQRGGRTDRVHWHPPSAQRCLQSARELGVLETRPWSVREQDTCWTTPRGGGDALTVC